MRPVKVPAGLCEGGSMPQLLAYAVSALVLGALFFVLMSSPAPRSLQTASAELPLQPAMMVPANPWGAFR
ncbi:hypothetical protein [Pseudomonas sp. H9]|uniref:hypothetical protein n=1 Tax=Pseudomonas sp. H9 TaxID=483968 RepID=UPI001057D718|nr:hypothetical protein [Pseudomonas sp. H9]TDF85966.1 hypothetical protein E1573_03310 [Pseudomonas sp. H9]